MSAPLLLGEGLVARRIRVAREDVAWVRYVVEAHDNLASVHVAEGGVVTLVSPSELALSLERVLADLAEDLRIEVG